MHESFPFLPQAAHATIAAQLLAAAEDGTSPGQAGAPLQQPRRTVISTLIVEDAPRIADRLVEMVTVPGEVEVMGIAATEALAIAACERQAFDLAVVDLQLAKGTGFAVIRRLRANDNENHRACIIVLTNHAVPALKAAAIEAGADHFLDKSKDFARIPQLIRALQAARGN